MWQTGGHAPPGNFDFGPFIRHNLVESGTVFAQTWFTIYCVIKAFIIDLHVNRILSISQSQGGPNAPPPPPPSEGNPGRGSQLREDSLSLFIQYILFNTA